MIVTIIVALVWSMKECKLLFWVSPLLFLFHQTFCCCVELQIWGKFQLKALFSVHFSGFLCSVLHCCRVSAKQASWQGWELLRAILYYGSGTASNLPKPANILIPTAPQIITHKYFIHFCHMQHQITKITPKAEVSVVWVKKSSGLVKRLPDILD